MSARYDSENDLRDLHDDEEHDREISLGTTTILGIFFLLALLCAVFFGFGYSMGRRSKPSIASIPTDTDQVTPSDANTSKPSPNIAPSSADGQKDETADDSAGAADSSARSTPPEPQSAQPAASVHPVVTPAARPVSMPKAPTPPVAPPTASPGTGTFVVQVAAVSHQEDANVLTNALKKHGYSVAVRQTQQDKLLHVQIGPFATKKEADVMRQRLLSDGYNAIVK